MYRNGYDISENEATQGRKYRLRNAAGKIVREALSIGHAIAVADGLPLGDVAEPGQPPRPPPPPKVPDPPLPKLGDPLPDQWPPKADDAPVLEVLAQPAPVALPVTPPTPALDIETAIPATPEAKPKAKRKPPKKRTVKRKAGK